MPLETDRNVLLALLRAEKIAQPNQDDWRGIVHLAELYDVSNLLFLRLRNAGLASQIPAELLQELHAGYLLTTARNLIIYHELAGLFERFKTAGIPGILLKGSYLVEHIYGDLGARAIGDVDLLARKSDLAGIEAMLRESDFVRPHQPKEPIKELHHFIYQHASNGLVLELHWGLIDQIYPIQVDIEALWERSRAVSVAGIPMREMSPEDQVLHLCVHASVSLMLSGLRALCDLAETLRHFQDTLDWESLGQRASLWKAQRCVYIYLNLARELLVAPVPQAWLNSIQPPDFEQRYLSIAREHLFGPVEESEKEVPSWHSVVEFWANGSVWRKFVFFWQRLFLPREIIAMKYSLPANSLRVLLCYPLRLVDLLRENGRLIWQLLRGDSQILFRAEKQDQVNALRHWMLVG